MLSVNGLVGALKPTDAQQCQLQGSTHSAKWGTALFGAPGEPSSVNRPLCFELPFPRLGTQHAALRSFPLFVVQCAVTSPISPEF